VLALDFSFFLVAAPAVVFAGVSKGGFGSGAAFAAASILALVVPPGLALGVMLPMLMLIDVASLRPYWGKWRWAEARLLMISGVPGVAFGAALYTKVDDDVLRVLIGAISLAFVGWRLALRLGWVTMGQQSLGSVAGGVAGFTAGFTSFISHAGGPPVALYLLSKGITKTQYQATTVLVFWVINIAKFVPYAFLGMFTYETGLANILLAPFALFGAWLGVKAHHLVSERLFFGFTYVILAITGCKLIWDGLT
jgi:uncharacterized membrane protein YfcA